MLTLLASDRSLQKYQEQWDCMRIDPLKVESIISDAKLILKYRRQFELTAQYGGGKVPWYFLGITYLREEGCLFKGHIHNGDSLRRRTVNVPAGRPIKNPASPSGYTFFESATDLIQLYGWNRVIEWSIPAMLYYFESNNGFGYRKLRNPINSPYLWSGTQLYQKGKFDSDGHYNPSLIDAESGCAPLIKFLTDKTLGLV